MRWAQDIKTGILALAPTLAAIAALAAGLMLLASGATPSEPERLRHLIEFAPLSLVEISHFLSSILGLVLVLLAFGLRRRLDAAWAATIGLVTLSAILALLKGFNWEESVALGLIGIFLVPLHEAFPRKARLTRVEITPGWMLSALAAIAGTVSLGLWSFHNVDYSDELWWRVMADNDVSRSLRASAGVAILFMVVGIWRLLSTPATPPVVGDDDPTFERVRAILEIGRAHV